MAEEVAQDISSVLGEVEIPEVNTEDNDLEQVDSDVDEQVSDDLELGKDEEQVSDDKNKKSSNKTKDILKSDFKDLSPKLKSALKENPELKSAFFQVREYAKAFDTPQKAQEVSELLDLHGGIDAIKSDIEEWSTTDMMFQSGDEKLVDTWAEMSPEGFAKIVPSALNKLYSVDPEAYNHVGSKLITSYLSQPNGLISAMTATYNTLDPKSNEAKLLNDIYTNYLEPIIEMSKKAPEKKVDPERQKLMDEKKLFENQKQEAFLGDVTTETNSIWISRLNNELDRYTNGKNISEEQMGMLKSNIDARFKKVLAKDGLALQQMVSILRSGDKAKYIKYMQSKLDKYMPSATEYVWRIFSGVKGTSTKVTPTAKTPTTPKSGAPILVNRVPRPDQVDREATSKLAKSKGKTYNDLINNNTVVLKNGKIVRW